MKSFNMVKMAFLAAGCLVMTFAMPFAGEGQQAKSDTAGKSISSLMQSGGVETVPSMIQGGLTTMAPPFFGQGGGQGQQQPQHPQQPGVWGQPQQPAQPGVWGQPQQPQNPAGAQALTGMWMGQFNGQMFVMIFMDNGMCGLGINNQQFYGNYTVQGSYLHMQMQNGQTLDVEFSVQGDTLQFSDGTVLKRQQMPAGQPQAQQPGPWGQAPQGQPNSAGMQPAGTSPLEGTWSAQTPNGMFVFEFRGNQYRAVVNGMQIEAGMFQLNGNRLHYQVTQGQNTGQQGVNTWQIHNNVLILFTQNGGSMQLMRQQR